MHTLEAGEQSRVELMFSDLVVKRARVGRPVIPGSHRLNEVVNVQPGTQEEILYVESAEGVDNVTGLTAMLFTEDELEIIKIGIAKIASDRNTDLTNNLLKRFNITVDYAPEVGDRFPDPGVIDLRYLPLG